MLWATPLGLGKANYLVNEFFRRAREDPQIDLHIFTALALSRPHWKNELERRFLEPLNERIFPGYPELEYVEPALHEKSDFSVPLCLGGCFLRGKS